MLRESNYNTIYESLFCAWNISNNPNAARLFENRNDKHLEKVVQVIKTNKIDKIARIGLMIIKVKYNIYDIIKYLFILLESYELSNLPRNLT